MAFTFLHTADWQIGKTFGRFPPEIAVRLRAARLDAIDRLASRALEAAAHHVVVAGDVVDSEHLEASELRQLLARLSAYPTLEWHLLPGNHDPARAGGVWGRLSGLGMPANVRTHLLPEPYQLEEGVILLPAPLHAKEMRADPTGWMDGAATAEGSLRIGLAHGSVKGFDSLGEAAVPIDPDRLSRAGLDYLALGDWHGVKEIAQGVWYSGTPEPDRFIGNDPGYALVVRLDGRRAPPHVSTVPVGQFSWLSRRAMLTRAADVAPIEAEIGRVGAERRNILLELRLEGVITAGEAAGLEARIAQLMAMVLSVDVDRRRLRTVVGAEDVDAIADPVLAAVAARLRDRAQAGDAKEMAIAARAMRQLLVFEATLPAPGETVS